MVFVKNFRKFIYWENAVNCSSYSATKNCDNYLLINRQDVPGLPLNTFHCKYSSFSSAHSLSSKMWLLKMQIADSNICKKCNKCDYLQ